MLLLLPLPLIEAFAKSVKGLKRIHDPNHLSAWVRNDVRRQVENTALLPRSLTLYFRDVNEWNRFRALFVEENYASITIVWYHDQDRFQDMEIVEECDDHNWNCPAIEALRNVALRNMDLVMGGLEFPPVIKMAGIQKRGFSKTSLTDA
jgi:hypothetical protein